MNIPFVAPVVSPLVGAIHDSNTWLIHFNAYDRDDNENPWFTKEFNGTALEAYTAAAEYIEHDGEITEIEPTYTQI